MKLLAAVRINTGPVHVSMVHVCPALMVKFKFLPLGDVDRTLGEVKVSTCLLDPWPSWLIKVARKGLAN